MEGDVLPDGASVATNYAPKIRKRFSKYRDLYESFKDAVPEVETMFEAVVTFLEDYVECQRFKCAHYIHGDPVFSNCLLDDAGQVP